MSSPEPTSNISLTDALAERDAWRRRALSAEHLAVEQAETIDRLAARPQPRPVPDRPHTARWILALAILLPFVAFIGGVMVGDRGGSTSQQTATAPTPASNDAGPVAGPAEPAAEKPVAGPAAEPSTPVASPSTPAATPGVVTVKANDNFWSLAKNHAQAQLGRTPTTAEIVPVWTSMIQANTDRLPDPGNPNLILPGAQLVTPT